MIRKLFLPVILLLAILSTLNAQSAFQLVESVPVETTLESSTLPRTLDVWLEMINGAKSTLDIETFYFANQKGEVLEKILNALKDCAGKGVKIRVIIDESFYKSNEKSSDLIENTPNITIKKIPFRQISGGVMHAKYFVVDGEELFLGSQNTDWRAIKHIHEIGVRIRNKKLAATFLAIFNLDWKLCDNPDEATKNKLLSGKFNKIVKAKNPIKIKTEEFGDIKIYPAFSPFNATPKSFSKEETELLKIIKKSRKRLCIHVYSYSIKARSKNDKYDKIDAELRKAAARGVSVKIIFSNWAIKETATDDIKRLSEVPGIEIKFSSIPEYSGGFIPYSRVEHTKYFIADNDISWVSTSNWEEDYFYQSRNATLIIKNNKVNSKLEEVFLRTWNSTYAETVDVNKDYKSVKRK